MFRQARRLARQPLLIVSVARDANVKRIKGFNPESGERRRLAALRREPLVDRAVLGAPRGYLSHIVSLRPDIIALGYDQTAYTEGLAVKLKKRGLNARIIRLKSYLPHKYKTSLLKRQINNKR